MTQGKDAAGSQPVWSKLVGEAALAAANIEYCAGYDVRAREAADSRLAPFDLRTNAAHLLMLAEQSILPPTQAAQIAEALTQLKQRLEEGTELLRPSCEDIHMSIESAVTEIAGGDAGGRLHTGRSRNDQVATDMRLFLREQVTAFGEAIAFLAEAIAEHARAHAETVCPGFTHGQPAMVTSWGHWTMSYLPRLLRVMRQLAAMLPDLSTCPLGAAASFGTSWPLNRERTAELLGFKYPTPSGADGIWCRGELEARFAFILAQYLAALGGIAQDVILLSSPPRKWLRLADEHVTGSSIMPQKRNPDFAEVTRSRASVAAGIAQGLLGIGKDLPSGYNRDTQWTKYLLFDAVDNAEGAAQMFASVFKKVKVNADEMARDCEIGFLNATDVADYLSRSRGISFRSCYRILGAAVRDCEAEGKLLRERLNKALAEAEVKELTEEEWAPLGDANGLLLGRNQTGNPHPDRTRESIEILLKEIRGEHGRMAAHAQQWKAHEKALWEQVEKLAAQSTQETWQ